MTVLPSVSLAASPFPIHTNILSPPPPPHALVHSLTPATQLQKSMTKLSTRCDTQPNHVIGLLMCSERLKKMDHKVYIQIKGGVVITFLKGFSRQPRRTRNAPSWSTGGPAVQRSTPHPRSGAVLTHCVLLGWLFIHGSLWKTQPAPIPPPLGLPHSPQHQRLKCTPLAAQNIAGSHRKQRSPASDMQGFFFTRPGGKLWDRGDGGKKKKWGFTKDSHSQTIFAPLIRAGVDGHCRVNLTLQPIG